MLERPILPAPYPRQMEDHFIRLGEDLRAARARGCEVPARWQAEHMLRRLLGLPHGAGFADDQPLNTRLVGTLERDGFRIEKVVYESRPGFYVTGALYLPDLPHPVPGVLCPHGHWPDGRYNPEVQRRCVGLARRGYVVLAIDKVGYQDRAVQDHRSRIGLLSGLTTQGIQVYDNQRGIDLLCSRPEVLPDRIGCTACSGGGNQTMYVRRAGQRITARRRSVVSNWARAPPQALLHLRTRARTAAPFDLPDICALIAPRALLLVHGLLDSGFRIDSARKAFEAIRGKYAGLGCPDRVQHFVSVDAHGYNAEMRAAVYDFFDCHLKGLDQPGRRPDEEVIESPETLRCLPDGLPAGHQTLVSLARLAAAESSGGTSRRFGVSRDLQRFDTVPDSVAGWQHTARQLRAHADRQVLHWPEQVTPLRAQLLDAEEQDWEGQPYLLQRLLFRSEPDVIVPACQILPRGKTVGLATVWLGADGHRDVSRQAVRERLLDPTSVFLLDPRGTGDTRSNDPHGEWQAYLSSVTLGRHLAVMRAWDIRRAADLLSQQHEGPQSLALRVEGDLFAGLVGLLAAAFEPRFQWVEIRTMLAGYGNETDFGELGSPGQNAILPRLLSAGLDIGRLMALIAPRRLVIEQFVDGCGTATPRRPPDIHYCQQVYELHGAADELVLP